jgi:hypothetical protein
MASLLKKSLILAPALDVTKVITSLDITFVKSDLDIQQTDLGGKFIKQKLENCLSLAPALDVVKLITIITMTLSNFVVLLKSDLGIKQTSLCD